MNRYNTVVRYRHFGDRVVAIVPTRDSAPPARSVDDSCNCSYCRERRETARLRTRDSLKIGTVAELNEANRKKYAQVIGDCQDDSETKRETSTSSR